MNALDADPAIAEAMQRLHRLTVCGRWFVVLGLWSTLGTLSLWNIRDNIQLWLEYPTWAAVRYAFIYHHWSALGLALCFALTASVLTWQGRNFLFGLPQREQNYLQQQVLRIRRQGTSHPLWRWVYGEQNRFEPIRDRQDNNHQ